MSIDGVEFAQAWPNRQKGDFDGIPAKLMGTADLIENKSASARPQDIIDIESLANARLRPTE